MTKPSFGNYVFTGSATTGMPDATCVGTIGQFAMVGKAGTTFGYPYTVQWSNIGDPDNWATPGTTDARTNQAGEETLDAKHGKITAIAGNDFYGYVFQENAITKFTYIGGDVVFSVDTFEDERGCVDFGRMAQVDDLVFFQSERGYHILQNDQIADVGFGKVDNSYRPATGVGQEDIVANPQIHTFFIPSPAHAGGDVNLCYNYKTDQWSILNVYQDVEVHGLYGVTDKDDMIGAVLIGNSNSVDLQTSNGGTAQSSRIETAVVELNPGRRALLDSIRIHNAASITSVNTGCYDYIGDTPTNVASTLNARTNVRHFLRDSNGVSGRFHDVDVVLEGDYSGLSSFEIEYFIEGKT